MIYVTYDTSGALTGGYNQDLHDEHADHYIEVAQDVQLEWPKYRANAARDGVELLPPVEPPTPTPAPRHITKFAFRERFTSAEKVAIELASIDDPTASMPARHLAAAVRVSLADAAAAEFIDLEHAGTRNGVQALEEAGILAAERAIEILDAEIDNSERYP